MQWSEFIDLKAMAGIVALIFVPLEHFLPAPRRQPKLSASHWLNDVIYLLFQRHPDQDRPLFCIVALFMMGGG